MFLMWKVVKFNGNISNEMNVIVWNLSLYLSFVPFGQNPLIQKIKTCFCGVLRLRE